MHGEKLKIYNLSYFHEGRYSNDGLMGLYIV